MLKVQKEIIKKEIVDITFSNLDITNMIDIINSHKQHFPSCAISRNDDELILKLNQLLD